MWTVVIILALAGFFGGLANHLTTYESRQANERSLRVRAFFTSVVLGLAASFMVPLFLSMISSNLIESISAPKAPTDFPAAPALVLMGFGLAASIFSRRFIELVSNRVS